ncbi:MAG: alpha-amylase family protein [Propionibacteriaceae bacterium]
MTWVDSAIWWQVYPLGFAGAEKEAPAEEVVQHRLPDAQWLDYLVELGCNGLALGPVFASQTHGYDTVDLLRIDARLGDDADFDALVAACRERGIRILLDGVFNHVGREHPKFVQALREGVGSEAARWFHLEESDGELVAKNFEGHDQLVALNHDEPEVIAHVTEVMSHWLDRGVDGWRLDAAYTVPTAFWATVLPAVREQHPEAWFVGEVIHGDYVEYLQQSTLDSVTEYELWKAVHSSLNDHNFWELDHTLGRHNELVAHFSPLTFIGNHDVTRLASVLKDPDHLALAVAVLLFVGGVPSIYYGDEQGFLGIKEERFGGDDAIRPEFPDQPSDLPPEGWTTYHLHQQMISIRRRHPWLSRATTETLQLSNEQLALSAAAGDGSERLVLLLNTANEDVTFDLELDQVSVVEQSPGSNAEKLVVEPAGWAVISATR